ncbi:hypothetical protein DFH27DRAFT_523792 [Peziza echinospora]|nr:hypothetical protein DFH27DRAFT_523792 [Peziza echinospora]
MSTNNRKYNSDRYDERQPLLSSHDHHGPPETHITHLHTDNLTPLQEALHNPLHAYLLLRALGNGYLPSTKQLSQLLIRAEKSHLLNPHEGGERILSSDGRYLLDLLRRWFKEMAILIEEKNKGDEVQELVWAIGKARAEVEVRSSASSGPLGNVEAMLAPGGGAAYASLKTLTTVLFSSRDFQALVADLVVIGRQTFSDAAQATSVLAEAAAEDIQPDARELNGIGRVDAAGVVKIDAGMEERADRAQREVAASLGEITTAIAATAAGTSQAAVQSVQRNVVHGRQGRALKLRLRTMLRNMNRQPTVPEALETFTIGLKYYIKSFIPAAVGGVGVDVKVNEKMEEVVVRVARIIGRFGAEAEWKELGRLISEIAGYVHERQMEAGKGAATTPTGEPEITTVDSVVDRIVEGLVGVIADPEVLLADDDDDNNEETQRFGGGGGTLLLTLLRRILRDAILPSFQSDDEFNKEHMRIQKALDQLLNQIHTVYLSVLNDKDLSRVLDTTFAIIGLLFPTDPTTNTTSINMTLTEDSLANLLLPALFSCATFIPIPRLEILSPEVSLLMENLILAPSGNSQTFLPRQISLETKSHLNLTQTHPGSIKTTTLVLKLQNFTPVQAEQVGYVMHVHTFPFCWLKDRGFMSFWVPGGWDLTMELDLTRQHTVTPGGGQVETALCTVKSVKSHLHNFDYTFSEHRFFGWMLKPFLRPILARTVERRIEEAVDAAVRWGNREVVLARERVRGVRVAGGGIGALVSAVWSGIGRWRGEGGSAEDEESGEGAVDVQVGILDGKGGPFENVYAPGSLVGLWREEVEEGRRAGGVVDGVKSRGRVSKLYQVTTSITNKYIKDLGNIVIDVGDIVIDENSSRYFHARMTNAAQFVQRQRSETVHTGGGAKKTQDYLSITGLSFVLYLVPHVGIIKPRHQPPRYGSQRPDVPDASDASDAHELLRYARNIHRRAARLAIGMAPGEHEWSLVNYGCRPGTLNITNKGYPRHPHPGGDPQPVRVIRLGPVPGLNSSNAEHESHKHEMQAVRTQRPEIIAMELRELEEDYSHDNLSFVSGESYMESKEHRK